MGKSWCPIPVLSNTNFASARVCCGPPEFVAYRLLCFTTCYDLQYYFVFWHLFVPWLKALKKPLSFPHLSLSAHLFNLLQHIQVNLFSWCAPPPSKLQLHLSYICNTLAVCLSLFQNNRISYIVFLPRYKWWFSEIGQEFLQCLRPFPQSVQYQRAFFLTLTKRHSRTSSRLRRTSQLRCGTGVASFSYCLKGRDNCNM